MKRAKKTPSTNCKIYSTEFPTNRELYNGI